MESRLDDFRKYSTDSSAKTGRNPWFLEPEKGCCKRVPAIEEASVNNEGDLVILEPVHLVIRSSNDICRPVVVQDAFKRDFV